MVDGNVVYISFNRWEETIRHSFVSHLSAEFHRKDISFFACEGPTSDDSFSEESDVAMAKARVSVVILSEKFASSKRFLNEFLKVLEFRRSNGLVVVPVFYGLTTSVLKKQCLKLKRMYPDDEVADWRNALLEIAALQGYTSSHKRSDSELVEKIVADVRQKLDHTGKIGVYSRLMKIENLICKQPCGIIRSLGIWGMGGIGKTTLAKAAFEQLSGDFEASCFIKDFDKDFQEKGAYGLLEKHLRKQLGLSSNVTRLSVLIDTLRRKRILLVLDDVWKSLGATNFLCEFDWLGSGSLIIITSRDKQVLVQCQVNEIYEVQGLNKDEALQLFSRCAFGKGVTDEKLLEHSLKFVDYANGNPLALSIYGRELNGKTPLEMMSVIGKLKLCLPDKIFNVFKSSYDALSDSEKEIFLEIVFSFRRADVDSVMQFLAGCGFFPRVGINLLVDKSLVTISENRVQMHNLIYDFGLQIIKDPTEKIEMGYRFLDAFNIKSLLEENEIGKPKLENEDIKAISLNTSNLAFKGHVAFQHMYNLRSLNVYMSSDLIKDPQFCLPGDSQSLPPELRLLHWEYCPLQSFPQDFGVKYLVELNMKCSKLQKLWGGTKNLEVLKRIRLSHSMELVNIDELQYSQKIELIDLRGCSKLQSFPDMSESQHLRVVNLSTCIEIKSFPKVPPSIRKLHLQGTGIRELSSLINYSSESQGLSNALEHEHSHLEDLTSQVNVSSSNQDLGKLVLLKLKDCSYLRTLPDMVAFESLEVLDLSGCSELEEIQGFPQNLKKLYLAKTAIREIPFFLCHSISKLAILDMENCKRLRDLPMGMDNMKSLATLKLSGCSKLENIQDLPRNLKELYLAGTAVEGFPSPLLERLSELVILSLENCKMLQSLPMGMSKLKSLVTLTLSGCSKLETIHDFPQNLKELYLVGTAIRELPSSIGDLAELHILDLKNCKRLRQLPMEIQNLNPLQVLDLLNCSDLEVLTSSLPKVRELRQARTIMPLGVKVPSSFAIVYVHIVTLSLYKAHLKYFPEEICWMPSVKTLDLSRNSFKSIPVSIKEFSKLLILRLRYCEFLRSLPQLPRSLQLLNAHGCLSLRLTPLDFEQLPRYYIFSNCFDLSPHMVTEVLAKALPIVEYMEPQRQQELENALAFSFCLPSPRSQNSNPYLQPGSSVLIRLNPHTRSMLMGFAILVEVSFSKDFHGADGLGFRCVCRWNDKKGHAHRIENSFHSWDPCEAVPKIKDDHMFVFFDLKTHPSIFERDVSDILADLVVFELFLVNKEEKIVGDSCRVTKCGVYVINDAAGSSSQNTITPLGSSLDLLGLSDDEVKIKLRVNYDGLQQRDKALFLYMACLLSDEKVDLLVPFLASIPFGIRSRLEVLATRSLIHISSKGEVMMPLLQRQLCREIVRRQSTLPASTKELIFMAFSGLSRNREYDVFLSFNGKDVRKTAIAYFIQKLNDKRIRAFKGDKSKRRLLISKAIRESSIAVVVFSKNYGSSRLCLNELVEIMKCWDELGQVVIPIFYDVDPSDVWKQIGQFGKGFKRTCKNNTHDEGQRWSRALTDAARFAVESSLNWTSDGDVIEKVVNEIWKQLNPTLSKDSETQIRRVDCGSGNTLDDICSSIYATDNPWAVDLTICIEQFFQLPSDRTPYESPASLTTEKETNRMLQLEEKHQNTEVKPNNNLVVMPMRKLTEFFVYMSCTRNPGMDR